MKTRHFGMKISPASLFFFCSVLFAVKPAWSSDVPGVDVMQLSAEYWIQKLEKPHIPLLSPTEITQYNQALIESSQHVADPLLVSETLSKQTLLTINQYASPLQAPDSMPMANP